MHARTLGAGAAVAAALSLVATVAPVAQAKSPHQVDPASLTPALNPDFAPWSCAEVGTGITCQGETDGSFVEPTGLFCAGGEVWAQGTDHQRMTRWHTADGRATRTVVHLDFPGDVFSYSPDGSGPTFTISGHWNRHYTYAVPGDVATRTLTEVGSIWLGRPGGGGVAFRDSGTVTYVPGADFEEVAVAHGAHDVLSDPGVVDAAICAALDGSS